tara:strand:- start:115 stop:300 length:186 start_codon:yes stop_codon:yes gene_type:complete
MKTDYEYVIRAIRNKNNKLVHYPAIKNLIELWSKKWFDHKEHKVYDVYLHSLNINLKRCFR